MGTSIKNTTHQIIIKNPNIDEIIILLKIIQLKDKTNIPKQIIDQGWHQYGFKAQKFFLEFMSIKETIQLWVSN